MSLNLGTFKTDLKAALLRAQVLYHIGKRVAGVRARLVGRPPHAAR